MLEENTKPVKVKDLKPGDMVDGEQCKYLKNNPLAEFEFFVVDEVTQESPTTYVVEFRQGTVVGYDPEDVLHVHANIQDIAPSAHPYDRRKSIHRSDTTPENAKTQIFHCEETGCKYVMVNGEVYIRRNDLVQARAATDYVRKIGKSNGHDWYTLHVPE